MEQEANIAEARAIMIEFADRTGLSGAGSPPRRYLWTDAHAVCNFLSLYRRTGGDAFESLALSLIDQVHNVIECFWRKSANQQVSSWLDHRDINSVMLATSLLPDEFLAV